MSMIAFMSDWGYDTYYVGVAKAIIKSICKDADIIDLTHQSEDFNLKKYGAMLYRASQDFPEGTIFLAVVDPGVGGQRAPIVLKTKKKKFIFIGPDNGLFSNIAEEYGIDEIYELNNKDYFYRKIPSTTFHGRDIFAPAAAHIANGVEMKKLGKKTSIFTTLRHKKARVERNVIEGEILYYDAFGNAETNIRTGMFDSLFELDDKVIINIKGKKYEASYVKVYADMFKDELLIHEDSSGFMEIAVNMGRANELFKSQGTEKITIMKG